MKTRDQIHEAITAKFRERTQNQRAIIAIQTAIRDIEAEISVLDEEARGLPPFPPAGESPCARAISPSARQS